jgi:tRNA(Ile)-lysidine synthase
VHELAERVLRHIRQEELLRAGDRVGVAVSGGIDSVALLRLLVELRHELGIVLSVVHFNHKLRGAESDADQEFVAGWAREHGLEFYCAGGDAAKLSAEEHSGLEAAARELRYGFFGDLLGAGNGAEIGIEQDVPQGLKPGSVEDHHGTAEAVGFQRQNRHRVLTRIATGHTLDDQAETVLMRLIRGTGLRGLGGIYPRIVVEHDVEDAGGEVHGEIVRPLLGLRRRELETYLADVKQPWREDSSNADSRFTRNRVRTLVLPLLEREFNPALVESLANLAEIARDEEDFWENEVSGWLGTVVQWTQPEWARGLRGFDRGQGLVQIQASRGELQGEPKSPSASRTGAISPELLERLEEPGPALMNASVSRPWLLTEPRAVQRKVLLAIGEQAGIPLEFKHVEEILRFAAEDGPAGKELSLPLGWKIVREPEAIVFVTPDLRRPERIPDYEYPLPVPGRVMVAELGVVIEAWRVSCSVSSSPSASASVRISTKLRDAEYNPQQLLRADLLPERLMVRNWRPGDRFWPAQTKSPKKIKELLQERHVAQPMRRLWPVAASKDNDEDEEEIVWMRGFPVPARLRAGAGEDAVVIREMPWETEESAS